MKTIINNHKLLSCSIVLIVLFILPTLANAQPGFGDDVEDVPVDGGLSLLIAAGVGYGTKKLKKKENNRNL